jgi:hypothetical protein
MVHDGIGKALHRRHDPPPACLVGIEPEWPEGQATAAVGDFHHDAYHTPSPRTAPYTVLVSRYNWMDARTHRSRQSPDDATPRTPHRCPILRLLRTIRADAQV